jgi:hypothetical protein
MIFVGDDRAEDHHDVHVMDEVGTRLAARRLPEGLPGIGQLHEMLAGYADEPGVSRAVRGGVREVARIGGHAASALASVLASRSAFAQVARCSRWRPMSDQCWWEGRGYRPSSS